MQRHYREIGPLHCYFVERDNGETLSVVTTQHQFNIAMDILVESLLSAAKWYSSLVKKEGTE
jgi:hypothetical protein